MELKQLKTIVISFILILLVLIPSPLFVGDVVKADAPVVSSPYPANTSVDVEINPTLNITINDADGNDMNLTWYSNSSGSWEVFGTGGLFTESNYTYGFEEASELENWTTTGIISAVSLFAHSGTHSLEIEGASEYACHNLSLANYSKVNISWWNYPFIIEDNEYLNLTFYDGTSWTTVRTVEGWQVGIEDVHTNYYDELDTNTYVFNDDCKICWNVSASDTSDGFYLDDINITYGYTGSIPNGTYTVPNSNFSSYNTTYYWNVSVNDGTDTNNYIFHFTTLIDTTKPTITINFAGNLSDSGGPYWRSPGESIQLTGVWSDGYYTNDSRQHEDWIYINLTVNDTEWDLNGEPVNNVWLQWINGTTYTNWTYAFANTAGDYWEYNTSGNIQTCKGYDYSFDIVANDSSGNSNLVGWNKTGMIGDTGGNPVRRYIQLNCAQVNISYEPYYFTERNETWHTNDASKRDRLHHDQGTMAFDRDTGYLRTYLPDDNIEVIWCTSYFGNWFEESQCIVPFTLNNIYYHVWWSAEYDRLKEVGWGKKRTYSPSGPLDYFGTDLNNATSNIYYDGPTAFDDFYLETRLFNGLTERSFTDNDIYEFYITLEDYLEDPTLISNRSFTSFVLLNVPDNATLNASHADTDSDGLSDWTELYVNYTNPFLADTDDDGVSDYDETLSGSDPNNYTDTIEYDSDSAVGYPNGYFYFETEAPHANSLIVAYDETWHYYTMS